MHKIYQSEASAARRTIQFRLFTSNGTAPDTGASNDSLVMSTPSGTTFVPDVKLSAANANQGQYYAALPQSSVSVLGMNAVYHTQGDFAQHVANVLVDQHDWDKVQSDHREQASFGLALQAVSSGSRSRGGSASVITLGSGETTTDDVLNDSILNIMYDSGQIVAEFIDDYDGSDRTAALRNPLPAAASAVTYWIYQMPSSNVTIASVVTVQSTLSVTNLGNHSVGTVTHLDNQSVGTLDSFGAQVNTSIFSKDMGDSRLYQDMFHMVRNRKDVAGDGSRVTFYLTDDSTALFGSSSTSGTAPLLSMDP